MNITSAASAAFHAEDAEAFQLATAATLRALGGRPDHAVTFGRLWQSGPEHSEFPTLADDVVLRGLCDLQAAELRFPAFHARNDWHAAQKELFFFLDQTRRAACLGAIYHGARDNIVHLWAQEGGVDFRTLSEHDPSNDVLNNLLQLARNNWLQQISTSSDMAIYLQRAFAARFDEQGFVAAIQELMHYLWHSHAPQSPPTKNDADATGKSSAPPEEAMPDDQSRNLELQRDDEQDNDAPQPATGQTAEEQTELHSGAEQSDDGLQGMTSPQHNADAFGLARYRIYSTEYDETIKASELVDVMERRKLRLELEEKGKDLQRVVQRLAQQLQQHLQSWQVTGWQHGLDDGALDLQRLARVYTHRRGTRPLLYKQPWLGLARDSTVTLLLDNSGSMRGRPILTTALCADLLARTLERCGVSVEILGYTTRAWKGGRLLKEWQDAGKPLAPGRLNEIRHIIYKSAEQRWQQSRLDLAVMLKEGLLRENIDGEALLWAYQRLSKRPEKRKILMVISDGAPVDDATLAANHANYLDEHLHDAIHWIEAQRKIELLAIGIGHDVTRYYKQATMIRDVETLGATMLKELGDLLRRPVTAQ